MSTRSELLFRAYGKISNPFVLCTLISKRTQQFMTGINENRGTAELVNYALGELLTGVLEFEMHVEKDLNAKAPRSHSILIAASRELLEVEAK